MIKLCFENTRQLIVIAIDQNYCNQCSQMHANVNKIRFQYAITLKKEEIKNLINEMSLKKMLMNKF